MGRTFSELPWGNISQFASDVGNRANVVSGMGDLMGRGMIGATQAYGSPEMRNLYQFLEQPTQY
jgi:hypothetical protein